MKFIRIYRRHEPTRCVHFKFDFEHGVWQGFNDDAFYFNDIYPADIVTSWSILHSPV